MVATTPLCSPFAKLLCLRLQAHTETCTMQEKSCINALFFVSNCIIIIVSFSLCDCDTYGIVVFRGLVLYRALSVYLLIASRSVAWPVVRQFAIYIDHPHANFIHTTRKNSSVSISMALHFFSLAFVVYFICCLCFYHFVWCVCFFGCVCVCERVILLFVFFIHFFYMLMSCIALAVAYWAKWLLWISKQIPNLYVAFIYVCVICVRKCIYFVERVNIHPFARASRCKAKNSHCTKLLFFALVRQRQQI